jgi:hypothetical protein
MMAMDDDEVFAAVDAKAAKALAPVGDAPEVRCASEAHAGRSTAAAHLRFRAFQSIVWLAAVLYCDASSR